jgi:hypothetical protein
MQQTLKKEEGNERNEKKSLKEELDRREAFND